MGRVYSWGVPHATGLGTTKMPIRTPTCVDFSIITAFDTHNENTGNEVVEEEEENAVELTMNNLENNNNSNGNSNQNRRKSIYVKDIACGSCFTVAVLSNGRVATWGVYDNGRLGQG